MSDEWGLSAPPVVNQCLPSGDAALAFVRAPSVGGFVKVLGTMMFRGSLVGAGIYLAGARGKKFWLYTAAGTGGVEVGVLCWALYANANANANA